MSPAVCFYEIQFQTNLIRERKGPDSLSLRLSFHCHIRSISLSPLTLSLSPSSLSPFFYSVSLLPISLSCSPSVKKQVNWLHLCSQSANTHNHERRPHIHFGPKYFSHPHTHTNVYPYKPKHTHTAETGWRQCDQASPLMHSRLLVKVIYSPIF